MSDEILNKILEKLWWIESENKQLRTELNEIKSMRSRWNLSDEWSVDSEGSLPQYSREEIDTTIPASEYSMFIAYQISKDWKVWDRKSINYQDKRALSWCYFKTLEWIKQYLESRNIKTSFWGKLYDSHKMIDKLVFISKRTMMSGKPIKKEMQDDNIIWFKGWKLWLVPITHGK